eukprot:2551796-Rhodomonas_salina.1
MRDNSSFLFSSWSRPTNATELAECLLTAKQGKNTFECGSESQRRGSDERKDSTFLRADSNCSVPELSWSLHLGRPEFSTPLCASGEEEFKAELMAKNEEMTAMSAALHDVQ